MNHTPEQLAIPLDELLKDKREALEDIANCLTALRNGITWCAGGSVSERMHSNHRQLRVIDGLIALKQTE